MAYEMQDGQGTMFQNTYKEVGDKKPDLRGECVINGELMEIAGWWKNPNPEKGEFLSLKIQPKQQRQQTQQSGGDGQGAGQNNGGNQSPPQNTNRTQNAPPSNQGRPGGRPGQR